MSVNEPSSSFIHSSDSEIQSQIQVVSITRASRDAPHTAPRRAIRSTRRAPQRAARQPSRRDRLGRLIKVEAVNERIHQLGDVPPPDLSVIVLAVPA